MLRSEQSTETPLLCPGLAGIFSPCPEFEKELRRIQVRVANGGADQGEESGCNIGGQCVGPDRLLDQLCYPLTSGYPFGGVRVSYPFGSVVGCFFLLKVRRVLSTVRSSCDCGCRHVGFDDEREPLKEGRARI